MDERVTKDLSDYVALRMAESQSIVTNITPTARKVTEEGAQSARFQKYLVDTAKGCFLFVKLTLDLIERGHLVLKSSSFKVLPLSLSEVFLLEQCSNKSDLRCSNTEIKLSGSFPLDS